MDCDVHHIVSALIFTTCQIFPFIVAAPTVLFAKGEDAEIPHHGPELENWPGLEYSDGLTLLLSPGHEYCMTWAVKGEF